MRFKTHNDHPININFTSLQGYIQATRAELISIFGAPKTTGHDSSVTCEWRIEFEDGTIATIYDWRRETPDLHEQYSWHVGGRNRIDQCRVHDVVRAAVGMTVRSAAA
jgi:hypothetical protein